MSGSVQMSPAVPRMMMPPRFPPPSQLSSDHSSHAGAGGPRPRLAYQPYRLYPRAPPPGAMGNDAAGGNEYDGRRLRKSLVRKTVDYNAAIITGLQNRVWQRDHRDKRALEPDYCYAPDTVPPSMMLDNCTNAVTTRYVKSATNKMRCPIFSMAWTPEGRRLVTGASSGEFTLWNGLTFNFETILQAHDSPVRSMIWSHNDIWMVTGDHAGYVKYWQSNMNNVKMFQAHKEAIRGLSFSPSDQKFVSCSDDGTVRVWDFYTCYEEKVLRGHGADVKCVDWHPHKGIVVSGSKDNQQPIKIWDPKAGIPLATLHAHKSTVMDARWNKNGNWLITASRDHLIKLFDIRKLSQELQVFRGHKKEASCVSWHPVHESMFASGGSNGDIMFWNVGCDKEIGSIESAHDNIIWTLAWHPVGHILCSGSNDHTSKFWTRQKPGDIIRDRGHGAFHDYGALDESEMEEAFIPGMGPEDKIEAQEEEKEDEDHLLIPGLDLTEAEQSTKLEKPVVKKTPYQKPIPKKFQAIWNDSKVDDELDDEKGRNPLLPRPGDRVNSSTANSMTAGRTEAQQPPPPPPPGPPQTMGIFNPNIGFGPMGTQYNGPPSHMGSIFSQGGNNLQPPNGPPPPPPPGPSPFLNPSQNPFWTPPMNMSTHPPPPTNNSGPGGRGTMRINNPRGIGNRMSNNNPHNNAQRGWNR